jgi:hypothetical protein
MSNDQLTAEQDAYQSVVELYQQIQKSVQLHQRAGLQIPDVLRRAMSVNGSGSKSNGRVASVSHIPAPMWRNKPDEAKPDWIRVELKQCTPTALVLAILRESKGPVRHRDLVTRVSEILPHVPSGSISNVGTRLEGKLIERTPDGWKLIDIQSAGIMKDGALWGPPSIFGKYELAAHRREAILYLLEHHETGLELVQIVEELRKCSWVHAPTNKDLVKGDIEILDSDGAIRRRGNTRKWEVAPTDKLSRKDSAKASAE